MKEIIEKAVEGGYKPKDKVSKNVLLERVADNSELSRIVVDLFANDIIFSIPFLKAYFGEEELNDCSICHIYGGYDCDKECPRLWENYAQQLVLSEDRIKYLKGFLNG